MSTPLAYFISFTCYGQWLPGDPRGSVDRRENQPGTPWIVPDVARRNQSRTHMTHDPCELDPPQRRAVLGAIREVCRYRDWLLRAAHVRSRHVHVVVSAPAPAERVMNDLKAYAGRALNRLDSVPRNGPHWTRHGSTRYINDESHLARAIVYVIEKQGVPQEVFDGRVESNE